MKKLLINLLFILNYIFFTTFTSQAFASQKDPEDFLGKSVIDLEAVWGKPIFKEKYKNNILRYKYFKIHVFSAKGKLILSKNRLLNEGDVPKGGRVSRCITDFDVLNTGLVIAQYQKGNICYKPPKYPSREKRRLQTIDPVYRYDGPEGISVQGLIAQYRFQDEDFDSLEKIFRKLTNNKKLNNDGRSQLSNLMTSLYGMFIGHKNWSLSLRRLKKWQEKYPKSQIPFIAESVYWRAYAWNARGSGYARTVTKSGRILFKERLQKAKSVLDESDRRKANHQLWYESYIYTAQALGWKLKDLLDLYQIAKKTHPDYYYYNFQVIRFLTPQWGGSYELINAFITFEAANMDKKDAAIQYTRMYWSLNGQMPIEFNIFRDSYADWKKMKAGFIDLMKKYPMSYWNLNNFEYFSCRAGDKEQYQKLRPKLKGRIHPSAWPANYSIDVCDHKMLVRM